MQECLVEARLLQYIFKDGTAGYVRYRLHETTDSAGSALLHTHLCTRLASCITAPAAANVRSPLHARADTARGNCTHNNHRGISTWLKLQLPLLSIHIAVLYDGLTTRSMFLQYGAACCSSVRTKCAGRCQHPYVTWGPNIG